MRKVYKTNYNSLSLQLIYKGLQAKVEFTHGMVSHNIPARLATSDPLLQDILESDNRFGSLYVLESSSPTPDNLNSSTTKVPLSKSPTIIKIKDVKNITDAIDFLSDKGVICTTLEEVNEAATRLNISFPNMK